MKFEHREFEKEKDDRITIHWSDVSKDAAKMDDLFVKESAEEGIKYLQDNPEAPCWWCETGDTLILVSVEDDESFNVSVATRRRTAYTSIG